MDLAPLLHQHFGFREFRPNQQAVCQAAVSGQDVLLVMPTGAGKSLCYQLPGLVRGGTTLVLSPLIALMDDQANKLAAAGHRVARIHSGLDREQSRQACRDYLSGDLSFLFIAPERLRVPGFPEMLAKRKPSLIAIDEAHCISGWGHDFRPDYRTLGDHLPALRPAPVIALTATATPTVQQDIVTQLRLASPALFIHGFRRTNLAIEVVEMSKPRRNEFVQQLLSRPGARPAIVYAPSRKAAEELASLLGGKAAAYHAGLDPSTRERVQRHFLEGSLEVVVATIAFGMGVDKADVRTVVHTALPSSVEGFYQEIGRAGRDGLPSRTVLLHSFADRKMHDFFLERDYPAATEMSRLVAALRDEPQDPADLARKLRLELDTVTRALDKLAAQGVAALALDGTVRSTETTQWRSGYEAQLAHRRAQIDRMAAFTGTRDCRMTSLVRHFGDSADTLRPCGHCDICAPGQTQSLTFRDPTSAEQTTLRHILRALEPRGLSTGRLHTELESRHGSRGTPDRKTLDHLLDGLARAGLLTLAQDTFNAPDGRSVSYLKATLTHEGRNPDPGDLPVLLQDTSGTAAPSSTRKRDRKPSRSSASTGDEAPLTPDQQQRFDALRLWRKALASSTGKPAFIILGDSVLRALSISAPTTLAELSTVSGIGPDKRDRYGADLLATLRNDAPAPAPSGSARSAAAKPISATQQSPKTTVISTPAKRTTAVISTPEKRSGETPVLRSTDQRPTRPAGPLSTPDTPFTPAQTVLDERLRTWRQQQSEALNLPTFFVLNASTLRRLVLTPPRTLGDLGTIEGLGREKIDRFGPDLIRLCTTPPSPSNND